MASFTFAANPDPCAMLNELVSVKVGDKDFYQIGTCGDLYKFADMVNKGAVSINGMLTADIVVNENLLGENSANVKANGSFDLNAYKTAHDGANPKPWTPIGINHNSYAGTFTGKDADGNVHTISGLYLSDDDADYTDGIGLFGVANGAVIKNFGVLDSYFYGESYVGGVAGNGGNAFIDSAFNAAVVKGESSVGGVVGGIGGTVSNSYNVGFVMGRESYEDGAGGVVGSNYGVIKNAYNKGSVKGYENVGGVLGLALSDGEISFCFNEGSVDKFDDSGNCPYESHECAGFGGVVGANGRSNAHLTDLGSTISDVYNVGMVTGLVGVGGVVGVNRGSVSSAYNAGVTSGDGASVVGGIVGIVYDGTVSNAYYNTDVCENCNNTVGTGKTTIELAGLSVGSAFSSGETVWGYGYTYVDGEGNVICGLPYLQVFGDATRPTINVGKLNYEDVEGGRIYKISTAAELKWFATLVSSGASITGKLTSDICLNACGEGESVLKADGSLNDDGSNFTPWTPMGIWKEDATVVLDGNGKTISGLYFDNATAESGGLFSYVNGTVTISKLRIEDSYVKGQQSNGAFVGFNGGVVNIESCKNEATVVGTRYNVGGFVGYNGGTTNLLIQNSVNAGVVTNLGTYGGGAEESTGSSVSGLVGGTGAGMLTIVQSANLGTLNGTSYNIGGLVGYADANVQIVESANEGAVTSTDAGNVGGLVGSFYFTTWNNKTLAISGSYNSGAVNAAGWSAGGLVGTVNYGNLTVSKSFDSGSVNSTLSNVGGLVGHAGSAKLNIETSYNKGSVNSSAGEIGGLVGQISESDMTIENCFNAGIVAGKSWNIGGLLGHVMAKERAAQISIANSYNTGVTVHDPGFSSDGLIGSNYEFSYDGCKLEVTKCYYNKDLSINGGFGVGMTTAELAATTVSDVFEGNEWTAGAIVNADKNPVTYKLLYLTAFGATSQPTYSGYGPVVIAENGAYAGIVDASDKTLSIPSGVGVNGPVLFKRSFSGDGFSTIMLPFQPNFTTAKDTIEGVNFYEFVSFTEGNVYVKSVSQRDLKANTPYLVKAAGANELVFKKGGTFNTRNGGVYNEGKYEKDLENGWTIYGTYDYRQWLAGDADLGKVYGFVGAGGNNPDDVGKFKKNGAGAYIYSMRAYLKYDGAKSLRAAPGRTPQATLASLPEDINVVIVDGENAEKTTAIGTINARMGEFKAAGDRYFDLKGRNMGKKPAAKGSFYSKKKVAK